MWGRREEDRGGEGWERGKGRRKGVGTYVYFYISSKYFPNDYYSNKASSKAAKAQAQPDKSALSQYIPASETQSAVTFYRDLSQLFLNAGKGSCRLMLGWFYIGIGREA